MTTFFASNLFSLQNGDVHPPVPEAWPRHCACIPQLLTQPFRLVRPYGTQEVCFDEGGGQLISLKLEVSVNGEGVFFIIFVIRS